MAKNDAAPAVTATNNPLKPDNVELVESFPAKPGFFQVVARLAVKCFGANTQFHFPVQVKYWETVEEVVEAHGDKETFLAAANTARANAIKDYIRDTVAREYDSISGVMTELARKTRHDATLLKLAEGASSVMLPVPAEMMAEITARKMAAMQAELEELRKWKAQQQKGK